MNHPIDRIAHTTVFDTPALAGTRNSSMGPLHEGLIRRPIAPLSYISLLATDGAIQFVFLFRFDFRYLVHGSVNKP